MTFITCGLNDLISGIAADASDGRVVVGPIGGPFAPSSECAGMIYGFDYGILSRVKKGFFVGTVELADDRSGDFEIAAAGIRNRFIESLEKARLLHVADTSSYLQFAHVAEGFWPGNATRQLRYEIEARKRGGSQ